MNLLDKVISWIAPGVAYQRAMYRKGLNILKNNYDGARMDRFGSSWNPVKANAEQTDGPYRQLLRNRARDLERNSDIAESVVSGIVRNSVGTGIRLQSRVEDDTGADMSELNNEIEQAWKRWCRARNCDVMGQSTFHEMQSMSLRRRVVDGEIFFIKTYDRTSRVPFKLQMIEADWLDVSMTINNDNGNSIVSGIEVDKYGKPVAYWFTEQSVDGFSSFNSKRVTADKVLHLFNKTRPSQVRGISELARVMQRIRDVGEYLEAEVVAQRIAACFALFVETNAPMQRIGRMAQDDNSNRVDTVEPGMIEYLKPGEKISAANPGRPTNATKEFVELQQRLTGAGVGLSYEMVSRDVSKVNYSSARQGHLEDRRTFIPVQQYMIEHLCVEVYTEWLISAVLAGEIDIPDFWQKKDKYLKHDWITPGWDWVDPVKEVNSAKEGLKSGLSTLAREAAAKGRDWQDELKQRAREQQFAQSLGLTLDIDEGGAAQNEQKVLVDDETDQ